MNPVDFSLWFPSWSATHEYFSACFLEKVFILANNCRFSMGYFIPTTGTLGERIECCRNCHETRTQAGQCLAAAEGWLSSSCELTELWAPRAMASRIPALPELLWNRTWLGLSPKLGFYQPKPKSKVQLLPHVLPAHWQLIPHTTQSTQIIKT